MLGNKTTNLYLRCGVRFFVYSFFSHLSRKALIVIGTVKYYYLTLIYIKRTHYTTMSLYECCLFHHGENCFHEASGTAPLSVITIYCILNKSLISGDVFVIARLAVNKFCHQSYSCRDNVLELAHVLKIQSTGRKPQ